jgi:hypothetical protein
MGKSWTERMNAPAEIVVKPAPVGIAGMRAGQVMLVPTTRLIAEFMAAVPMANPSPSPRCGRNWRGGTKPR